MAIPTNSSVLNKTSPNEVSRKNYIIPLILITSLFFLWGVANNLNDILIKQFKKTFELTDLQSGLVQSAFYFGYFLLAIPAANFMQKYSYKAGIIFGLCLYGLGAFLFYPAANAHSYNFFLFALFVIASGLAFLETAANPYVAVLGPESDAAFRLNLAQSFNPIGSITGILIGQRFIFSGVEYTKTQIANLNPTELQNYYHTEAAAVQMPYLIIGVIVLIAAFLVKITKFPIIESETTIDENVSLRFLLGIKHFRLAVVTQFFYVGAQVGIWSFLIRYAQHAIPNLPEKSAATFLTYSLIIFMVGRFIGTALMKYVAANRLMGIYALTNLFLVSIAIFSTSSVGVWALVAASFFMSIMFPTIFTLGLNGLKGGTKLGASLIVMAIIGGAILTALMGWISDMAGINAAEIVPALCFLIVIYYSWVGYKK